MQRENGGNRPPFSSPIFQFKFTNDAGSFGSHLAHGGNPMPELDPDFQTVTLSVTLSNSELLRAARLGGLVVALNDFEAFDVSDHAALIAHAELGMAFAIHDSFERMFPTRYPEDVDWASEGWGYSAKITGYFCKIWRGKVTW
jgi:hypothetical protein